MNTLMGPTMERRRLCARRGMIKLLIQSDGGEVKGVEIREEGGKEDGEQGVP